MMSVDKQKFPESASQISTSENFCREDFIGRDGRFTIIEAEAGKGAVKLVKARKPLPGGGVGKEEDAYAIAFAETGKRLVLNSTNRKVLQRAWGNKTKDWVGKKITLYYDPDVRSPVGPGGIRIRINEPNAIAHDATTGEVLEPGSNG
jgi:hypothetical protein